ncbi:MAG: peptidoglycan DD-metalloendopeptidase family protein [Magnetococcales bacterium]|nr:peptidoglycan DD-metalloendopeptidase family protein [Magnetococcales bacterium]MBF0151154.1 peptidoglycan DD-metalloendopeptidase family protein [Magnetococcales bacterium]
MFATRTRIQSTPVEKQIRERKFPSLLFGMVTVGLIATHGALNASTSGGVPTDYLGWLLRNEMTHIQEIDNDLEKDKAVKSNIAAARENDSSARESIRLAALRSPQVRLDRGRPQLSEHNQVIIERISRGDTLSSLLQRQNISLRTIYAIARGARPVFNLSANFQTGKLVKLVFDRNKQLLSVSYPTDDGNTLIVKRTESGDEFKGALEKGDFGVVNVSGTPAAGSVTAEPKSEDSKTALVQDKPETVAVTAVATPSNDNAEDASKAQRPTSIPIKVKQGDVLTGILAARNIDENIAMEVAKASRPVYDLARMLQPGKVLNVDLSPEGLLLALSYPVDDESIFWLRNEGNKFVPKIEKKVFDNRLEAISGTIRTDGSLFAAGSRSGLTHSQSAALANLFEYDIDFARDIHAGDRFSVVREVKFHEGKRVGEGRILAAEFINQGTVHRVVYYANPKGEADYYDAKGQSIRKMFIRAPVDFRRISSLFSSNRKHPVFGFTRAHKGVDYAADMGTPVRAAGDGVVTHVGTKGSFGKLILIRHNSQYTTAYAHLHRYANEIRLGARVKQGQMIGQVGMTGASTGPHLHYEIRVDNKQVDPLSVQMASATPVPSRYMSDFYAKTAPVLAMLKSGTTKVAALVTNKRLR